MQTELQAPEKSLNTCSAKRNKGIPIELLIGYAEKKLTYEEIGRIVGCHKSNVTNRLASIGYHAVRDQAYQDYREKVLRFRQSELLNSITPNKLKETSVRDAVVAFGILHDKELDLTQGRVSGPQITVIQAQAVSVDQDIRQMEEELAKLMARDV